VEGLHACEAVTLRCPIVVSFPVLGQVGWCVDVAVPVSEGERMQRVAESSHPGVFGDEALGVGCEGGQEDPEPW
jgi:hypothetical protein